MRVVVFAAPAPHHGYRIGVRYDEVVVGTGSGSGTTEVEVVWGCWWGMRVGVVAARWSCSAMLTAYNLRRCVGGVVPGGANREEAKQSCLRPSMK